jgi:hypothetical protein
VSCCSIVACTGLVTLLLLLKPNQTESSVPASVAKPARYNYLLIPFSLTWNSLVPSGSVHTQCSSVRFRQVQVKSVQCSTLRNGTCYDRLSPVYCPTPAPAPGHSLSVSDSLYQGASPHHHRLISVLDTYLPYSSISVLDPAIFFSGTLTEFS